MVGQGFGDLDFASLIELEARNAGYELRSEARDVDDGLSSIDRLATQGGHE